MKVIYVEEEDYAPYVDYDEAYIYLDTENEELSILTYYTFDAQTRRDFAWGVSTILDNNAYNNLLDEVKPLATKLLKHHTIEDGHGYLDEDGEAIEDEIEQLIGERVTFTDRRVYFVGADREDVDHYYSPWDVSPSKLREIARETIDPDSGYVLYLDNDAENYEIASMNLIGEEFGYVDTDVEEICDYLSRIYSVYEKDGFASDFEDVLLPFLEEEGYIEYIDGDWYLADTEDDEDNHIPLEWK